MTEKYGSTQFFKYREDDSHSITLLFPHADTSASPVFWGLLSFDKYAYKLPEQADYALRHPALLGLLSVVKKKTSA